MTPTIVSTINVSTNPMNPNPRLIVQTPFENPAAVVQISCLERLVYAV